MAEAALTEIGPQTPAENRMNEHIVKLQERAQGMSISGKGYHTSDLESMSDVCPQDGQTNSPLENDKPSSSGRCFYTHLPGLIKRVGMSASELTALNLDKVTASLFSLEIGPSLSCFYSSSFVSYPRSCPCLPCNTGFACASLTLEKYIVLISRRSIPLEEFR